MFWGVEYYVTVTHSMYTGDYKKGGEPGAGT